MSRKKTVDTTLRTLAVIGSLVFVNILGVRLFGRADLTHDDQFTLNEASRNVMRALQDPITVTAYFTRDLPPPYSTNARYVRDLLEEYYNYGSGNFRYEFVNPEAEETDEDKEKKKEVKQDIFGRAVREATTIERELGTLGIPPVQVRVNEGDKLEVKRAYMGIAIKYRDKHEVIPVVSDTANLEYDLTTMVRKLTREKTPKVALVTGHGGPDQQKGLTRMHGLLGQLYDVTTVDLSSAATIPDDVDAIIIAGPKTAFSDAEKRAIDAFVMSGRSAAFLLDAVHPDLQTMQSEEANHGLGDLLASYGASLEPGLVLDPECATINVAQQRGPMRIMQPVRYPFVPVVQGLDASHPLTRGLAQVAFPFTSAVSVNAAEGVKADVLVKSSSKAWVQAPPFNLDPLQRWTMDMIQSPGQRNFVVTLSGALKSPYDGAPVAEGEAPSGVAESARVLVAGGSAFIQDDYLSKPNEALLLNMLDWLVLDEALLAVRSRGLAAAPLDGEIGDGARNTLKTMNILGLPMAFVAFGLVRWRLRENRRRKVTL